MNKAELIVKGAGGVLFDTLDEAMDAGREMQREGAVVHIEVYPAEVPGPMTRWRYKSDSDEWLIVTLPLDDTGYQ